MGRPIDRRAVDQLVVEHLPMALRLALRLTGDSHAAEDLVQETLCRVLRQWRTYRGQASFRTWFLQVLVNADRDRRRRRRIVEPVDDGELASPIAAPPELAAADELKHEIRAAIDQLPDRQREVALLAWGEGLAAADIAHVLGVSETNVYANIHHARQRIAATIGLEQGPRKLP